MLLNELLKAIQPVQVTGDSRIEITGVNIASRLEEAGQQFMALRGTQTEVLALSLRHEEIRTSIADAENQRRLGLTQIGGFRNS